MMQTFTPPPLMTDRNDPPGRSRRTPTDRCQLDQEPRFCRGGPRPGATRSSRCSPLETPGFPQAARGRACWSRVLDLEWEVPGRLGNELVDPSALAARDRHAAELNSEAAAKLIVTVASIPAVDWYAVARWAKETHNLEPWQRRTASEIGKYLSNGWDISIKQAKDGERLMSEARQLGFQP
jgi:hypothetical protein